MTTRPAASPGGDAQGTHQSFVAAFDSIAFARCNEEWDEIEELHRIRVQKQIEQSALQKKLQEVVTLLVANSHEIAAVDERIAKVQATIRGREHQTQGQLRSLLTEWESVKLSRTVMSEKEVERRHAKEVGALRRELQDALSAKKALEREVSEVKNLHERQLLAMQSIERPAADALLIAGHADRAGPDSVETPTNQPLTPMSHAPAPIQLPRQQSGAVGVQSRASSFGAGSLNPPSPAYHSRTIEFDRAPTSAADSTTASISLSQYLDNGGGGRGGVASKPGSTMGLTSPLSTSNLRPTSHSGTSESSGSTPSSSQQARGPGVAEREVPDALREMLVGPTLYREERLHPTASTSSVSARGQRSEDLRFVPNPSAASRSSPTHTAAPGAAPRSPQQEPIVALHSISRLGFEVVLHNREGHPSGLSGVAVAHVLESGPAWAAGLRENDVIQSWGGARVKTVADLKAAMEKGGNLPRIQVSALLQSAASGGGQAERLGPPRMLVLRSR